MQKILVAAVLSALTIWSCTTAPKHPSRATASAVPGDIRAKLNSARTIKGNLKYLPLDKFVAARRRLMELDTKMSLPSDGLEPLQMVGPFEIEFASEAQRVAFLEAYDTEKGNEWWEITDIVTDEAPADSTPPVVVPAAPRDTVRGVLDAKPKLITQDTQWTLEQVRDGDKNFFKSSNVQSLLANLLASNGTKPHVWLFALTGDKKIAGTAKTDIKPKAFNLTLLPSSIMPLPKRANP